MNKRIFVFLILISLVGAALAQRGNPYRQYNFENVDRSKVDLEKLKEQIEKNQRRIDSLYFVTKTDSLQRLYFYAANNPKNFFAGTFVMDLMSVDFGSIRREMMTAGFGDIGESGVLPSIAFGLTVRAERILFEYTFNIFLGNKKTLDGTSVKIDGANLINMYVGYDLINSTRIQLYPMIALNQQFTDINLDREPMSPVPVSSIFTLEQQYDNILLRKSSWQIGPALELDFRVGNLKKSGGVILGLRYGLNYTFAAGKYKVNGNKQDYDPRVNLRHSNFSIVVRSFD